MSTAKELLARARAAGIKGASKMNKAQLEAALAASEGFGPVEIKGEGGTVTVSRREDTVTVRWLCGAMRTFTVEDLRAALDHFEGVAAHGIWYEDGDSTHSPYAAVLEDGRFHGDDHVNGRSGHVPWDEFKAALEASLT